MEIRQWRAVESIWAVFSFLHSKAGIDMQALPVSANSEADFVTIAHQCTWPSKAMVSLPELSLTASAF